VVSETPTANPWWAWPHVRLGLIRAALFAPAVALVTGELTILASAWVIVLATLLESWASTRARTGERALAIMLAIFVISSVGLVAGYFQSVYVKDLIASRSIEGALAALSSAPRDALSSSHLTNGHGPPDCMIVVYMAECGGFAIAASTTFRIRPRTVPMGFFVIVALAPLLDATIYAALDPQRMKLGDVFPVAFFCSVMLGMAAPVATIAFELLRFVAALIDEALAARSS
jgi:hypothetical protein